jgi:hypothetical protein
MGKWKMENGKWKMRTLRQSFPECGVSLAEVGAEGKTMRNAV